MDDWVFHTYRGLLASLWSCVVLLTVLGFSVAGFFTFFWTDESQYAYDYNNNQEDHERRDFHDAELAVTSRAMVFCCLWTGVLAILVSIYGTVILGIQTPSLYYSCCSPQVHKTTPLSLGSLIGALLMFANLTLVCAVLFGEFNILDFREGREGDEFEDRNNSSSKSPTAFSILCMFLTILYGLFAGFLFVHSTDLLEEYKELEQTELTNAGPQLHSYAGNGYIGERFDVVTRRPNATSTSNFDLPPPKGIV